MDSLPFDYFYESGMLPLGVLRITTGAKFLLQMVLDQL